MKVLDLLTKLAQAKEEYAKGIPRPGVTNIPKLKTPEMWEYTLQLHETARNPKRPHADLRLGSPSTGKGYSWALPYAKLPEPGETKLAVRTFDHSIGYFDFSGKIGKGYGEGDVKVMDRAQIKVIESSPDFVRFTLMHKKFPKEYILHQTSGDKWIIMCTTQEHSKGQLPHAKPKFKSIDPKAVKHENEEYMTLKIDGAFSTMHLEPGKPPRLLSYRPEQKTEAVIDYAPKVKQIHDYKTPKELKGVVVRGELIARNKLTQKVLPSHELGGLLNSSPQNALKHLKDHHEEFEYYVFDVLKAGGKDVEHSIPYAQRHELLKNIVKKLNIPGVKVIPTAKTPEEKELLFEAVKKGVHPISKEGVVVIPNPHELPTKFHKAKFRPTIDMRIKEITKGEGKYKGSMGAILAVPEHKDEPVTHIGTGYSDAQRKWFWKNRDKVKNKIIEVQGLQIFPSGKVRDGAFKRFHLDKNIGLPDIKEEGNRN